MRRCNASIWCVEGTRRREGHVEFFVTRGLEEDRRHYGEGAGRLSACVRGVGE